MASRCRKTLSEDIALRPNKEQRHRGRTRVETILSQHDIIINLSPKLTTPVSILLSCPWLAIAVDCPDSTDLSLLALANNHVLPTNTSVSTIP